jgi:hypothetical protein
LAASGLLGREFVGQHRAQRDGAQAVIRLLKEFAARRWPRRGAVLFVTGMMFVAGHRL